MNIQSSWLMNGDVQLHMERRGNGPRTLLFIHGWISSRRMWYSVCHELPALFSSYLLDVRGCGLSDRPLQGHDLDSYASDVRTALATMPAGTVLVGHSMGGRLAQRIACDAPANLAGMVLVAPGSAHAVPPISRQRELAERACGSRRRIASFQRGAMTAQISTDDQEHLIEDGLLAQREHWFGWYDRGRAVDFSNDIPAIRLRTHIVGGKEDPLIPTGSLERNVVRAIAGATFSIYDGCGHNVPVEKPRELAREIANFAQNAWKPQ